MPANVLLVEPGGVADAAAEVAADVAVGAAAARLRAQWLTGRPGTDPVAVVRHLLAVQAQDLTGARLAVRARSRGLTAADVEAGLDRRALVVGWLNRGTLHLVAAEDYRWLHALTAPRMLATVTTRLRQEGVSPEQAERGVATVAEALDQEGRCTRARLKAWLDDAGVPTAGQALVHVLGAAAIQGLMLRGPMAGAEQAFVPVDGWLGPAPDPVDRAEALARLAGRYLAGHAPARPEDLAAWAGITLRDARAGLAAAAEAAEAGPAEPVPAGDAAAPDRLPRPVLLGPFDPVLHGWPEREWVVGRHRAVITVNGIFKATVLVGGRVVGTWTRPRGRVQLDLFEPVTEADRQALLAEAADVERYLAPPAAITR